MTTRFEPAKSCARPPRAPQEIAPAPTTTPPRESGVWAAVHALQVRVEAHARQLAALQRERTPSPADVALLVLLAEQADGAPFIVRTIRSWARASEAIADALDAASLDGSIEIACWLRGMRGVPAGGLELARGTRTGHGYRWRVQACTSTYTDGAVA